MNITCNSMFTGEQCLETITYYASMDIYFMFIVIGLISFAIGYFICEIKY